MSDELLDFIRSCAADCVNANEPERCTACGDRLPPNCSGRCLCCADTQEIPKVEAK
jgi:hypothetical protein